MSGDPQLDAIVRDARQARTILPGSRCRRCGSSEQLVAGADAPLCYGCSVAPRTLEHDHIAGIANLPLVTVALTPNAHRRVTEVRSRLGTDDWTRADGDRLLMAAHLLAGLASLVWLLAEWLHDMAVWLRDDSSGEPPPFPFPT